MVVVGDDEGFVDILFEKCLRMLEWRSLNSRGFRDWSWNKCEQGWCSALSCRSKAELASSERLPAKTEKGLSSAYVSSNTLEKLYAYTRAMVAVTEKITWGSRV